MKNIMLPVKESAVVRKPIAMTHTRSNWTLRQLRMTNMTLVKGSKKDFADDHEYHLAGPEIENFVRIGKTRNYRWRDKFAEKVFKPVSFNELGKDNRLKKTYMPLYSKASFVGKDFYFKFNREALPYLREAMDVFTDFEAIAQCILDSVRAVEMYEFLKAELAISGGLKCMDVPISLQDFRVKLGLEPHEYKQFYALRRDVIDPLKDSITEKIDLDVTWKPTRAKGRGG